MFILGLIQLFWKEIFQEELGASTQRSAEVSYVDVSYVLKSCSEVKTFKRGKKSTH